MKAYVTFMIIPHSVSCRMRNVSNKRCTENQSTHFIFNNFFFFSKNLAVYEIMWKNIVKPDRPQMTIPHMRIASKIAKATITHSEYVTRSAFP